MKIGWANGCFDLFHDGHRHYLTQCRMRCDYLIVGVNSDAYCRRVKGADRPFEPLERRMIHVRAFAEAVIPFEGREDPIILQVRPQVIFKGGNHGQGLTSMAARPPGWKDTGEAMWVAPVVHIGRLPGISTTLAATARSEHAPERDAGAERPEPPQRRP